MLPTASVVIAAYTLDRWQLLTECIESVLAQTVPARDVVLCIDNNDELFARAQETWGERILVMANPDVDHVAFLDAHAAAHGTRRRFGAGSARNAGVAATGGDVVAIIDDDARAEPDWLERLLANYGTERGAEVVAVGGAPLPRFESARPSWFPKSFDWVFGCAYQGLPAEQAAPVKHLIGANMSFRRDAFDKVGGFGSIDFDDLDLCMRLGHEFGETSLVYDPRAVVRHFVPADRVTWKYFWRRCFYVNVEKVRAFRDMGDAANLAAEIAYGLRTLTYGIASELARGVRGRGGGPRAAVAIVVGLACAVAGNVWGKLRRGR